jgi:adenylate cyclase
MSDFTMLGDDVNVTARLASAAAAGEIVISEAAYIAGGRDLGELEHRRLQLKGKSAEVEVRVLTEPSR